MHLRYRLNWLYILKSNDEEHSIKTHSFHVIYRRDLGSSNVNRPIVVSPSKAESQVNRVWVNEALLSPEIPLAGA